MFILIHFRIFLTHYSISICNSKTLSFNNYLSEKDSGRKWGEKSQRIEIIEKTFRFSRNAREVMKKNLHIDYGDTIFFGRFPSKHGVACLPRVPEMDYHCLGATLCRPNVKTQVYRGMWLTGGNTRKLGYNNWGLPDYTHLRAITCNFFPFIAIPLN